jgi:hypothetical protein
VVEDGSAVFAAYKGVSEREKKLKESHETTFNEHRTQSGR